jgi:cysteinyl-tRNA synthetase
MTLRYFILQAHYRGTLDFSNEGLQAAEKGMLRLMQAQKIIASLNVGNENQDLDLSGLLERCYHAMNEDINTPMVIAELHEAARIVNLVNDGRATISEDQKQLLKNIFDTFLVEILGIVEEKSGNNTALDSAMNVLIQLRNEARANKDFKTSDIIRDKLKENGIQLKDGKEGTTYILD